MKLEQITESLWYCLLKLILVQIIGIAIMYYGDSPGSFCFGLCLLIPTICAIVILIFKGISKYKNYINKCIKKRKKYKEEKLIEAAKEIRNDPLYCRFNKIVCECINQYNSISLNEIKSNEDLINKKYKNILNILYVRKQDAFDILFNDFNQYIKPFKLELKLHGKNSYEVQSVACGFLEGLQNITDQSCQEKNIKELINLEHSEIKNIWFNKIKIFNEPYNKRINKIKHRLNKQLLLATKIIEKRFYNFEMQKIITARLYRELSESEIN